MITLLAKTFIAAENRNYFGFAGRCQRMAMRFGYDNQMFARVLINVTAAKYL